MKRIPTTAQAEEGMKTSRELVERAAEFTPGYYIIPPFGNIRPTAELVGHIRNIKIKKF